MNKIEAQLNPLAGKYYGTEIQLNKRGGDTAYILVWINSVSDYEPSIRELEGFVKNDSGVWVDEYGYPYEICDDHFESATALEISNVIINAINEHYKA